MGGTNASLLKKLLLEVLTLFFCRKEVSVHMVFQTSLSDHMISVCNIGVAEQGSLWQDPPNPDQENNIMAWLRMEGK